MELNCSTLSRRQWLVITTFIVLFLFNGMCFPIQAPFYPKEAETKGCKPSEYGFVFGIYQLAVFVVSPVFGANLNTIGAKKALLGGIGSVAISTIAFGFLDQIEDSKQFLGLSFILRVAAGTGNSAFLTACFSLIAKEFPKNVETVFAILETFSALGMILGPFIGGIIYQMGDFILPFVVLGGCLGAQQYLQ